MASYSGYRKGRKSPYSKGYRSKALYGGSKGRKKTAKKSTTKSSVTMKKMVREIAADMLRGPGQKVTVSAVPTPIPIYAQSERAGYVYFRVPVTQAIPLQRAADANPDDRWRRGNKIQVKGVCVRMTVSFATTIAVMGVCYPAKVQKDPIPLNGPPATSFFLGKKDGESTRLLAIGETGFLSSKDGPYSLVPGGQNGTLMLDSPDQSLFNCRLSKGPGAPVGKVRWRASKGEKILSGQTFSQEFHVTSGMRTQDWGGPGGYTQMDSRCIEAYWSLGREVEFADALDGRTVFDPHLELMFGIRVPGALGPGAGKQYTAPVEAGIVTNVMVDVYYN